MIHNRWSMMVCGLAFTILWQLSKHNSHQVSTVARGVIRRLLVGDCVSMAWKDRGTVESVQARHERQERLNCFATPRRAVSRSGTLDTGMVALAKKELQHGAGIGSAKHYSRTKPVSRNRIQRSGAPGTTGCEWVYSSSVVASHSESTTGEPSSGTPVGGWRTVWTWRSYAKL